MLELSHRVLDFGPQTLASTAEKEFTLENSGTAPLTVEKMTLKGEFPDRFKILESGFPRTIPVKENIVIPVSFLPDTGQLVTAELEIPQYHANGFWIAFFR
ncbi:MAG: choice-of-anchor D domain-containing protein [bacterium]|nr:choice-of-anchor D domain-containing protein [bacterium]